MEDINIEDIYIPYAKVGEKAPSFKGEAYIDGDIKEINSENYKGKWTLLFFYPLDFTFVCPTEIKGYSDQIDAFKERGVEIVGCSVDSVHSHKAWSEGDLGKINFPLLSDITKDIADSYGVLIESDGIALRGTFIIDPEGVLRYSVIHDLNVGRSVEEALRVIDALQNGGLCPIGWHKGDDTLKE